MTKGIIRPLAMALSLGLLAPAANATDSRSQSLLYNLAFEDQTDVFLFPNLLPAYSGVYFHLPANAHDLFGGIIYGSRDQAFGAFVHRPFISAFDQYRITVSDETDSNVGVLLGDAGNVAETQLPGQVFDVMYGAKKWGMGLRFHLWSEVSEQQGELTDPTETESNTAVSADLNVGLRLSPALNMRGSVGIRNVKDTGLNLRALVGARYIAPGASKMRMVFAGELQFGLYSPESGDSSFALALPVKGGVRLTLLPDSLFVGLLGGIDVQVLKLGDADTRIGLAVPTVEIAAEWLALDWLEVRTAIKGGYGIQFAGDAGDNTPKYEQMAFSSGFGFPIGPFRIDAVVEYDLWHNGPYLIGGNSGLFAGVTLAYLWNSGGAGSAKKSAARMRSASTSSGSGEAPARTRRAPVRRKTETSKPAPAKAAPAAVEEKAAPAKKESGVEKVDTSEFEEWDEG